MDAAVEGVKQFVYGVDEDFSTYKDGSFVSKLRRVEISIDECPADVKEVWGLCAIARDLTDGAFDPWAVAGGFDPSGYVKGWAADRVAQILLAAGCEHIQVNAAGDLTLRGGINEKGEVGPWKIGVVNPDLAEHGLHAEGSRLVRDDRYHMPADVLVLRQRREHAYEGHGRGHFFAGVVGGMSQRKAGEHPRGGHFKHGGAGLL